MVKTEESIRIVVNYTVLNTLRIYPTTSSQSKVVSGEWRIFLNVRNKCAAGVFWFLVKMRTELNTEFTGFIWWGIFRALKQVKVTGKVTSYSTRYACVPLH